MNAHVMNRKQRRAQAATKQAAHSPEFIVAAKALNAGNFARARALAEVLVAQNPTDADSWNILAVATARTGDTEEAMRMFERGLARAPFGAELHRNYALMLFQMKRHSEAEKHFHRALELQPNYEEAFWGLGQFYLGLQRYDDAEGVFRRAMQLYPGLAKYPFQLARVMERRNQYVEMEPVVAEAIRRARAAHDKENLIKSLTLMGGLKYQHAQRIQALPFLHEAVELGGGQVTQSMFAQCVGRIRFAAAQPKLKPTLVRAFKEVWIRPSEIVRVSINLLSYEPAFKEALALPDTPGMRSEWLTLDCIRTIAADPLLLAAMNASMLTEVPLERLLTGGRTALLEERVNGGDIEVFAPFAVALAHQNFATEYASLATEAEWKAAGHLTEEVTAGLKNGQPVAATDIALIAAYYPLHTLPLAPLLLKREWPDYLGPLITRQVREPQEERDILPSIDCITPITDTVSEAVRNQYEENPYPRWLEAPDKEGGFTLASWLRAYFPEAPKPDGAYADPLEALVAGCGTGQQSVNSAPRFARSNVLAVDLSRASLAYAIRKTKAVGITNVTYAQADILELGSMDRLFDIVECGGVLHHFADPMKGWRVLTDITRPGGYQVIALYSERAREYLKPIRAFVKEQGFGTSPEELRRFRETVLSLPKDHPAAQLTARRDFYSLSMLRDLVFHVQEHRFTIPQLGKAIKELGLAFGGFNLPPESKQRFLKHFGANAHLLSLEQWAAFEEAQPETFLGMYQFLVKKPK